MKNKLKFFQIQKDLCLKNKETKSNQAYNQNSCSQSVNPLRQINQTELSHSTALSQKDLSRRDMEIGKQKENAWIFDGFDDIFIANQSKRMPNQLIFIKNDKVKKLIIKQLKSNQSFEMKNESLIKVKKEFFPLNSQTFKQSTKQNLFYDQKFHEPLSPSQRKLIQNTLKPTFDIKKFQQNILKQIISKHQINQKNSKKLQKSSSHLHNFKQIASQRKMSRSKSKQQKNMQLKKNSSSKFAVLYKSTNRILKQKLLHNLEHFDDYQLINIEDSIPILYQANILKILSSLSQTKSKIQSKRLPSGRVKEQAKFIYFLWKMINEEYITTRHLKEILILLNQLSKNDLIDTLGVLYCRQSQIIKMFVECWMKLKMDKFFYESASSKQKQQNDLLNSSKIFTTEKIREDDRTAKKYQRCKTQYECRNDQENCSNQQEPNRKLTRYLQPLEQKKLIDRLYEDRKEFLHQRQRVKTLNDEQKEIKKVKQCTFKPFLIASSGKSKFRSESILKTKNIINVNHFNQESLLAQPSRKNQSKYSSTSRIKGFEKTVSRLKNGHSQSKLKQQLLAYHSVGQNYEKIKQKPMNPPKFLSRQKGKKEQMILFVIEFEIGRHKVKVRIQPTDTEMSVSKKVALIYNLKAEEEEQIRSIVSMELNNYYKKISQEVSQFI